MKTIFEFTHSIMFICVIIIIYFSVGENKGDLEGTIMSSLISKVKSIRINRIFLYRLASNLLFIFLR
ncbi:hypothetical protein [Mucilaginibacter sp.]|uniref:hypothetical protein n=1 Tax=Mucilaginibacter sp. TaxID=1882438 RepID=UPI0025DDA023|nr:hypothetical protein [Mucilaginibacter sp.]